MNNTDCTFSLCLYVLKFILSFKLWHQFNATKKHRTMFSSNSKDPFADDNSSVIRQKGESRNGCFKRTKHAKFSEKRTFLTPWYAHQRLNVYLRRSFAYIKFTPDDLIILIWWSNNLHFLKNCYHSARKICYLIMSWRLRFISS